MAQFSVSGASHGSLIALGLGLGLGLGLELGLGLGQGLELECPCARLIAVSDCWPYLHSPYLG